MRTEPHLPLESGSASLSLRHIHGKPVETIAQERCGLCRSLASTGNPVELIDAEYCQCAATGVDERYDLSWRNGGSIRDVSRLRVVCRVDKNRIVLPGGSVNDKRSAVLPERVGYVVLSGHSSPPTRRGPAPKGWPLKGLRVRASRAVGLRQDQSFRTVDRPASHTVPTERLEAGQLVDHRTTDGVELLSAGLRKGLLTNEVRVVHAGLSSTRTSTNLSVDATRVLKEDSTLVLTDVAHPDVRRSREVVRVAPSSVTGLTTKVVRHIRVDVGGVVGSLGRVNLVAAQLGNRETNHIGVDVVVGGATDGRQRGRLSRSGTETVGDRTSGRVLANGLSGRRQNVLNDGVDRVTKVPRNLIDKTLGHVGEREQVKLVADQDSVTVLVESDGHGGRLSGRHSVRVNQLVERGDLRAQVLVQFEHDARTRHSLSSWSLVRHTTEQWFRTQSELKRTVVSSLDKVAHRNRAGKGVSHVTLS